LAHDEASQEARLVEARIDQEELMVSRPFTRPARGADSGVVKDSLEKGKFAFALTDALGRHSLRGGYENEDAASLACSPAKKQIVGEELEEMLESKLKSERTFAGTLEAMQNETSPEQKLKELLDRVENDPNRVISRSEIERMSAGEIVRKNKAFVRDARKLWQEFHDDKAKHLARVIAAKFRQKLVGLPHSASRDCYLRLYKFLHVANASERAVVQLVRRLQKIRKRDASIPMTPLTSLILELWGLDKQRLPLLHEIQDEKIWESAFFSEGQKGVKSTGKISMNEFLPLRFEEAFPRMATDQDSSRMLLEINLERSESEIGLAGAAQHRLALYSPFAAPEDVRNWMDRVGILSEPGSFRKLSKSENESRDFFSVHANLTQPLSDLYLTLKEKETTEGFGQFLSDSVCEEMNFFRLSRPRPPLFSWQRHSNFDVRSLQPFEGSKGLEARIEALNANSCLMNWQSQDTLVVSPNTRKSFIEFFRAMRELLPFRTRYEIVYNLKLLSNMSTEEGFNGAYGVVLNLVEAMQDHRRELLPLLNEAFGLESFRFLASIASINADLDDLQARHFPESVEGPFDEFTVHESTARYDFEKCRYENGSEESFLRPLRNGNFLSHEGDLSKQKESEVGLPEALSSDVEGLGTDWIGLDGMRYKDPEAATRTWYTPDIIGDTGTVESEAELWLSARSIIRNLDDFLSLRQLRQVVKHESKSALMKLYYLLVENGDSVVREQVTNALLRYWLRNGIGVLPNGVVAPGIVERPNLGHMLVLLNRGLLNEKLFQSILPYLVQTVNLFSAEGLQAMHELLRGSFDNSSHDDNDAGLMSLELINEAISKRDGERAQSQISSDQRMRFVFEDLENIGTYAGVQSGTPSSEDFYGLEEEDWVMRTVLIQDIPIVLAQEEKLNMFLESKFGPVQSLMIQSERSLVDNAVIHMVKNQSRKKRQRDNNKRTLSETLAVKSDDDNGDRNKSSAEKYAELILTSLGNVPEPKKLVESLKERFQKLHESDVISLQNARDDLFLLEANWSAFDMLAHVEKSKVKTRRERELTLRSNDHTISSIKALENRVSMQNCKPQTLHTEIAQRLDSVKHQLDVGIEIERRISKALDEILKFEKNAGKKEGEMREVAKEELKWAITWFALLVGVAEEHCSARMLAHERLNVLLREVERRKALVAKHLKQHEGSEEETNSGDDALVYEGVLGEDGTTIEDEGGDPTELFREEDLVDFEQLNDDLVDGIGELTTAETDMLVSSREIYERNSSPSRDTRYRHALERHRANKGPSVSGKQLPRLNMVNNSGIYAIATFADRADSDQATSMALQAFGMKLAVPRDPLKPFHFRLNETEAKQMDFVTVKVLPANLHRALYLDGLKDGLRATEISRILRNFLQPVFPGIHFQSKLDSMLLSNGACKITFRSFAETMAAYMILKDKSVMGHPLVVSWSAVRNHAPSDETTIDKTKARKPLSPASLMH